MPTTYIQGTMQDATHTEINKADNSISECYLHGGQMGKSRDFLEQVLELNPMDQAVYSREVYMYNDS